MNDFYLDMHDLLSSLSNHCHQMISIYRIWFLSFCWDSRKVTLQFFKFWSICFFSYIVTGLPIIGLADFQPFPSRSMSLRYRCINSSMTEDCKLMLCTSVDLFLYDRELGYERDKKPGRQRLFRKKKLTAKIC